MAWRSPGTEGEVDSRGRGPSPNSLHTQLWEVTGPSLLLSQGRKGSHGQVSAVASGVKEPLPEKLSLKGLIVEQGDPGKQ